MTAGREGRGTKGARGGRSSPELARLRTQIDELDRRIVTLINERNELVRAVGHEKLAIGRRFVRDRDREREVLLRVSIANAGPTPQADLLSIFRRLIASARALETAERDRLRRDEEGPAEPPSA
jgi:chorismate mutase / prephenate dehydratase